MNRKIQVSMLLALSLFPIAIGGCEKKAKGETVSPDEAEGEVDPMTELKAIPTRLQAEVDGVMQPLTDAEKLMGELETIPERYSLSAADFKSMVKASFDSETGTVELSADLQIAEDAKTELLATIAQLRGIKVGLETTPDRVELALENVIKIGADAVTLSTKLLASLEAKAKVAMGEKKAEIAAQIQEVTALKDQITTQIDDAKAQITELPARATEIGANFTASFAGSASAG
ncbi:hypothetical protein ACNOYE_37810 [Nannocystaceae bacterium ST9]